MSSNLAQQKNTATPSRENGEEMAQYFTHCLLNNEEALDYLVSRGVSRSTVEAGKVGLCPPYTDHWFPLLKGRIVVPIRDVHNQIVAFAGRIYEPYTEMTENALWDRFKQKPAEAQKRIDKWNKTKWLNEPFTKAKHLYNLNYAKPHIRKSGYALVVEGYFDALVLDEYGVQNVVASCGTAFTDWHCALIGRYCRHVIFIFDGDTAGKEATQKAFERLTDCDITGQAIVLPQNYDPDDLIRKIKGERFQKLIDQLIASGAQNLKLTSGTKS